MNEEIVVCGVPFGTPEEKEALRKVKDTGATSVQIYVYWRDFEPAERDRFDWEYYDRQVRLIQEAGLRFVPFILMGPKYAAPSWWLADEKHRELCCLEHGKASPVESVWNENFREEIDRVLKAFAAHYLPWDVLESIQPGICGDYGEAIFPVTGNWPGDYHTHRGFWCGGEDAAASFRSYLEKKYGTVAGLNRNWGSGFGAFREIRPFLKHKAPSRTAYLDLLLWYSDSMTDYAEFWMERCRKYFPETSVYLCTGGNEEPEHGSSFAGQARIAARHKGGIRLTNEGNNFYENCYLTVHMHSACQFYGAYMGLEPVGPILPQGVTARMFGSAAYGNRQVFHYYGNLFAEKQPGAGAERVRQYRNLIGEHQTESKIAFFWPLDEAQLNGTEIPNNIRLALTFLRRQYEVDVVSEQLILDGALDRYSLLIMLDAGITRESVLNEIARWAQSGGTVLSNRRTMNIEGDPVGAFDRVFGFDSGSEEVWGHCEYQNCRPAWTEKLNSIDQVHSMIAWNKLAEKAVPLFRNVPQDHPDGTSTREAFCAFENACGRGKGIFYSAPMDLDAEADAIWTPSKAFSYLLEDCCRTFGGTVPFVLKSDEIAFSRMGNGALILKEDSIVFEPNRN
jgi:Beta-galactosidase